MLQRIHILHGDITTKNRINPKNIVSKLGNCIREFAKSNHYKASDFNKIIHIVDTDGAYIPDTSIYEDSSADSIFYKDSGIYTLNIGSIVERNKQKKENLYRLRTTGQILGIPYKLYYMSCNLDHVLHNKINSTDEEKEKNSYNFAKKYKSNVPSFIDFICNSDFSVIKEYKESWEHIENDMNSIKRFSNFGICIKEEAGDFIS